MVCAVLQKSAGFIKLKLFSSVNKRIFIFKIRSRISKKMDFLL